MPAAHPRAALQDPVPPDKNAPEYKAVVEASRATHLAPLDLLQKAGAIDSAYQFHWKRFLFDNFPKGTGFPRWQRRSRPKTCRWPRCRPTPSTTRRPPKSTMPCRCRAWARAPWCWASTSPRPAWPSCRARAGPAGPQRLSTVYMPGYKITMLPDEVVQIYTLDEGRANPAVSLYVTLDEATLEITGTETRLERVPVVANLRHDQLDHIVTEAWLTDPSIQIENTPQRLLDVREQLSFFIPPGQST
jgi:exoribonuclease-2